jgi:hypothetical protein
LEKKSYFNRSNLSLSDQKKCNHPITVILNGRNSNDKFAVVFYVVSSKIAFFGDYIAWDLFPLFQKESNFIGNNIKNHSKFIIRIPAI